MSVWTLTVPDTSQGRRGQRLWRALLGMKGWSRASFVQGRGKLLGKDVKATGSRKQTRQWTNGGDEKQITTEIAHSKQTRISSHLVKASRTQLFCAVRAALKFRRRPVSVFQDCSCGGRELIASLEEPLLEANSLLRR